MHFSNFVSNEEFPLSQEEHLKRMVIVILQALEVGISRPSAEMTSKDLKCLNDAGKCIREHREAKRLAKEGEEEPPLDLGELGGEVLFREIAYEVKEWIFIYEGLEVRKVKQRQENKLDIEFDDIYLSEAYDLILDTLKRARIGMRRQLATLDDDQIKLPMYRDFLEKGVFEKPKLKPEILLKRYQKDFEIYKQRVEDLYGKLGTFKRTMHFIDLDKIEELGVQGLREMWRDQQMLLERVKLEYLGITKKANMFFREGFHKKIQRSYDKGEGTDEEFLFSYLKLINEFICRLQSSPDYGDTPEMYIALRALLYPEPDDDEHNDEEMDPADFIRS